MKGWHKGTLLLASVFGLAGLAGTSAAAAAAPADRIVGGTTTTAAAFPWQAAVVLDASRFAGNDAQRQFCAGTLLTPRIVQTAAHCLYDTDPDGGAPGGAGVADPNDIDVVLGRTVLSSAAGERLSVQAIYISSAYNPLTDANDFGWIVLAADAAIGPNEQTIDVAGPDEATLWGAGAQARVSGWGNTSEGGELQRPAHAGARPGRRGLALRRRRRVRGALPGSQHALRRADGRRRRLLPGRQRGPARLAGGGWRLPAHRDRELGDRLRAAEQAGRVRTDRGARRTAEPDRRDRGPGVDRRRRLGDRQRGDSAVAPAEPATDEPSAGDQPPVAAAGRLEVAGAAAKKTKKPKKKKRKKRKRSRK